MMILKRGTNLDHFLHIAGKTIKNLRIYILSDLAENNFRKYA
jgi:hypothetical protein